MDAFYAYPSGAQYLPQFVPAPLPMAPQAYYPPAQLQPALLYNLDSTSSRMQPWSFVPADIGSGGLSGWETARPMHSSQKQIRTNWEKASPIPLADSDRIRLDCMNAVIEKNKHGRLGPGGWDIDHSKPKAKGGTDHPNNLHPLHSNTNRFEKRDQYPYHYSQHDTLGETLSEFRARHHWEPSNVDGRSSLVKSGDLRFNLDGSIDRRSPAVLRGDVTVNKDGNARINSKAVGSGSLKLKS